MRVISKYRVANLDAGPKAKVDIEYILKENYDCKVKTLKLKSKNSEDKFIRKIYRKIEKLIFEIKNFNKNEIILIQSPFTSKNFITDLSKNKIAIVHDINGLRTGNKKELKKEIDFLKSCKVIISHNKSMEKFLRKQGIENKIINLEIFDYILNQQNNLTVNYIKEQPKIVYAGNLAKSPFLTQLSQEKMKFILNVYGVGIDNNINEKIIYKGKFKPDILPTMLEGNLGLVWDGNFDESDEQEGFKNYTKYNNPHKLSCYIAAGLPVIVWKKAAIAQFVQENNIGYVISNLYEINDIDFSDYEIKKKNVDAVSQKVREGYYIKKAIDEALLKVKEE